MKTLPLCHARRSNLFRSDASLPAELSKFNPVHLGPSADINSETSWSTVTTPHPMLSTELHRLFTPDPHQLAPRYCIAPGRLPRLKEWRRRRRRQCSRAPAFGSCAAGGRLSCQRQRDPKELPTTAAKGTDFSVCASVIASALEVDIMYMHHKSA